MPFLLSLILIGKLQTNQITHNVKISCRKEGRPENSRNNDFHYIEKASVSASSGSITVEAAYSIPLFLLAAVCLIWLLEIQAIRTAVESGMQEAGKSIAVEMYIAPIFTPGRVENKIVESIGPDRLERSLIQGGSSGIRCGSSMMYPNSKIMELRAEYKVRIPLPAFMIPDITLKESMRIKSWTGYVKEGFSDRTDETIVYVTETGIVYHLDYHCTYLELSIQAVPADAVDALRNQSEGKYHPCEHCMKHAQATGSVFITNFGNRYHSSLSCSGLKRTVYAVPLSEVKRKGACSKCGR